MNLRLDSLEFTVTQVLFRIPPPPPIITLLNYIIITLLKHCSYKFEFLFKDIHEITFQ